MNTHENWKLLVRLPDHVQKQALIHFLGQEGIESFSPDRDAITQLANEPQLSLGGYSTFFDGYPVYVNPKDWHQANLILEKMRAIPNEKSESTTDYLRSFQVSAFFSVLMPFVFHAIGFYYLVKAIKAHQFQWNVRTVFSLLIFSATFVVVIVFFRA
ncbi:MAG: hypothetical protein ACK5V3_15305 [Bdellovibrionales bacterium]